MNSNSLGKKMTIAQHIGLVISGVHKLIASRISSVF